MKFERNEFAEVLYELWRKDFIGENQYSLSQELLDALLYFGSETDDNVNCVKHVEFGESCGRQFGPPQKYGLKIRNSNILISDLIHSLEDDDIYRYLQGQFPSLNQAQIEAGLRLAVMVLLAFERIPVP
ncbi:MAG: hypothetical protein JW963_05785 [Anaerolineales bacterium]|nr:hypothetical protein [Anaerolineales bacterium]